MILFRNQRGDTIIEVLISVAVLSLVLSASFGLANRNSQAFRQAGERGEAQKLAQAEVEKLKTYLSNSSNSMPSLNSYFCMKNDPTAGLIMVVFTNPAKPPADPNADINLTNSGYPDDCKAPAGELYYRYIYRGTGPTKDTYTSNVRWVAVTGHGVDQVKIVTRQYPDSGSLHVTPFNEFAIANHRYLAGLIL